MEGEDLEKLGWGRKGLSWSVPHAYIGPSTLVFGHPKIYGNKRLLSLLPFFIYILAWVF